ncbi:MAG: ATPase [Hymenobacteraceae bacterium]|nr:ATPase [Hymenobacteraceae bacterium]MDX5396080.1 ATPase [Hymenobacteraceae bacterium]MDX5443664.1 ATPase [Hymenobacteraceae bacterium]MDX5512145.1 ATPase [Hymenobacteraceae bacterium]
MRWTTYINTILGILLLIYAHGIATDPVALKITYIGIDVILSIFVLFYFLRILYSFERVNFLKRTKFEGAFIFLIFLNLISDYVFDSPIIVNFFESIDIPLTLGLYRVVVTFFMITLLVIEIMETRINLIAMQVKPATTFILSFILLISLGTSLFMMPKMTNTPEGMSFIDALFMSASAACVTGLAVVDPGTYFTFNGQIVLLLLIQMGGLGIISFATFFATFMRRGIGIKHHVVMQNMLDTESLYSTKGLLRKIVGLTLSIEALGALFIFVSWGQEVQFTSLGNKIFFSVFHAISAFCNAGFSLFPQGLYTLPVRNAYILHLFVSGLIIFGGIGFPTIVDVLSPRNLRERLDAPWKNWRLLSRVTIYTSAGLIILGMVGFFLLEYYNTLRDKNLAEGIITAFFQSVTTRTAGFNTVDIGELTVPTVLLFIFLMFIGASPGSTGGGIKTTTFLVIVLSVWTTIRGKKNLEIGNRTIPHSVSYKAFSIFAFAAIINLLALFTLSITDGQFDILSLLFEQVSAFATVGLSTGITAGLSDFGKFVIIVSMFVGRVGTLTLALALSIPAKSTEYKYPKTHLVVG